MNFINLNWKNKRQNIYRFQAINYNTEVEFYKTS